MSGPYRIVGYAIASADGMIADANAVMPDSLKIEADHRFLKYELDRVDAVVHGRQSHEGHPNSQHRLRLVATHKVAAIAPFPGDEMTLLWNPAGASFEEACGALGLAAGTVAILGGPHIYELFLGIGYDAFHLCRAGKARLPGGMPVFPQIRSGLSAEEILSRGNLEPGPPQTLDEVNALTLVTWTRKALG
jgi:hypothetical protein